MDIRKAVIVTLVWVASLVGATLWAQAGNPTSAPGVQMGEPHGPIITGENIGFQRIAGPPSRDGSLVGRLVVKVDGQWFKTTSPMTIVR